MRVCCNNRSSAANICSCGMACAIRNGKFANACKPLLFSPRCRRLRIVASKCAACRDFKPENMLLDDTGHLKLTDFGCAKRMDSLHELPDTTAATNGHVLAGCTGGQGPGIAPSAAQPPRGTAQHSMHGSASSVQAAREPVEAGKSKIARLSESNGRPSDISSGAAAHAAAAAEAAEAAAVAGAAPKAAAPSAAPSAPGPAQTGHASQASKLQASPTGEGGSGGGNQMKRAVSFVGTADYLPPETLENTSCTCGVDLWGFGCVLYQMVAGQPPFRGKSDFLTMENISQHALHLPDGMHEDVRDIVQRLLQRQPQDRLGFWDLAELKQHQLFASAHPCCSLPHAHPSCSVLPALGRVFTALFSISEFCIVPTCRLCVKSALLSMIPTALRRNAASLQAQMRCSVPCAASCRH